MSWPVLDLQGKWSSARHYFTGEVGVVEIESERLLLVVLVKVGCDGWVVEMLAPSHMSQKRDMGHPVLWFLDVWWRSVELACFALGS
jgi:hypothetical protein